MRGSILRVLALLVSLILAGLMIAIDVVLVSDDTGGDQSLVLSPAAEAGTTQSRTVDETAGTGDTESTELPVVTLAEDAGSGSAEGDGDGAGRALSSSAGGSPSNQVDGAAGRDGFDLVARQLVVDGDGRTGHRHSA